MPYKDKDKHRAYQRDWVRQKRGSVRQGSTEQEGVTQGSTRSNIDINPLPSESASTITIDQYNAALEEMRRRTEPQRLSTEEVKLVVAQAAAASAAAMIPARARQANTQSYNPMMEGYVPPSRPLTPTQTAKLR